VQTCEEISDQAVFAKFIGYRDKHCKKQRVKLVLG